MHSVRLIIVGVVVLASGLTPLLFGLWKTLTGSAVQVAEAKER